MQSVAELWWEQRKLAMHFTGAQEGMPTTLLLVSMKPRFWLLQRLVVGFLRWNLITD